MAVKKCHSVLKQRVLWTVEPIPLISYGYVFLEFFIWIFWYIFFLQVERKLLLFQWWHQRGFQPFVSKILYIWSQFWLKTAKAFQSPRDEEKEPTKDTMGNSEYHKLCFLQLRYQLKNYFLMGNIWINLLNKYWCFITRSKIRSIPHTFGMCWPASGATEIQDSLGSSSFQKEAVCECFTPGNWKHQKSHREARSLLVN